jgi:hypothetical protein
VESDTSHLLPYLIPIAILALVVRRSLRSRKLKAERLWVMPAFLLLVGLSVLVASPPVTPVAIAVVVGALAVGAAAGWWRGRLTHITVDPATHELTSRASPVGVILIAGLYLLRYGLRMVELKNPNAIPGGAALVTDGLTLFGIGMLALQRLEMWLRCRHLLADARAKTDAAGDLTDQ